MVQLSLESDSIHMIFNESYNFLNGFLEEIDIIIE